MVLVKIFNERVHEEIIKKTLINGKNTHAYVICMAKTYGH